MRMKIITVCKHLLRAFMTNYHYWSQSYMKGYQLTFEEHHLNNEWFNNMLAMLKPDGVLYVPILNKHFNKLGEEL